jgi:signal transduction histidine kinase
MFFRSIQPGSFRNTRAWVCVFAMVMFGPAILLAQTVTGTSLTLSAPQVAAGTIVPLIAKSTQPVSPGQLSSGTAGAKLRFGPGAHSLTASVAGTKTYAKNGSGVPSLTATATLATSATLSDQTANIAMGRAALGAARATQTFEAKIAYAAGAFTNATRMGDFNRVGIPDLAVANEDDNTGSALLPPGEFRVVAGRDGVWNTTGATLPITMLPPFYSSWWFLGMAFTVSLAAGTTAWKYRASQLSRIHAAQQESSRQLINSQERERKRIAGELHDSLGQQLLIIKNWAVLALSRLEGHEALKEPLGEISSTASHAIEEMRGIAYNLRPYQLEKLGLTAAIRGLAARVAASSDILFAAEIEDVDGMFPEEVEISIYRIVQEALNNAVKHSQATEGRILMTNNLGTVDLKIEDNGRGFIPPDGRVPQPSQKGFGLMGIGERVRMLGGRVVIQSAPGRGSRIQISLQTRAII